MKIGETLAGRYVLREGLAACHGEAFLAEDLRSRRRVRVVVLEAGKVDAGGVRRYAELLARASVVGHAGAGLPQVQVALTGVPLFVVGELAPGEDLAALLRRERRLPWERALAVTQGCAEALAALAVAGAAHRALRPECVWVCADGEVCVHDFGAAELGPSGAVQRGPQEFVEYRAPEQVAGAPGDGRSDVFSLGAILLEMITGRCVFSGPTAFKAAHKVSTQVAPPASALAPEVPVPPAIEELIARALARAPGERLASAQALANHVALARRSPGIVRRHAAPIGFAPEVERTLEVPVVESEEDLTTAVSLPIVRKARGREGETPERLEAAESGVAPGESGAHAGASGASERTQVFAAEEGGKTEVLPQVRGIVARARSSGAPEARLDTTEARNETTEVLPRGAERTFADPVVRRMPETTLELGSSPGDDDATAVMPTFRRTELRDSAANSGVQEAAGSMQATPPEPRIVRTLVAIYVAIAVVIVAGAAVLLLR